MPRKKTVRTRKRGNTYSYIFEAGKAENGKRKVIEKGGYATEAAAYNAGIKALNTWNHGGIAVASDRILLEDYFESWLTAVHKLDVSASSYQRSLSSWNCLIRPSLGKKILQDIRPSDIDLWLRRMADEKGYSKSSLSNAKALLTKALNYAVYPAELILSNPAAAIKMPKRARTGYVKRTVISYERYQELISKDFPPGDWMRPYIILAYNTGMRVGEVSGLRWEDVDFERGLISIAGQITKIEGLGSFRYFYKQPKCGSTRTIPMTGELMEELREHKARQEEARKLLGGAYVVNTLTRIDNDLCGVSYASQDFIKPTDHTINLVCTMPNGRRIIKDTIGRRLKELGLNSHSLRHTHATMLVEAGAPLRGIANRLGHTSILMTDHYTSSTRTIQDETVSAFESLTKP